MPSFTCSNLSASSAMSMLNRASANPSVLEPEPCPLTSYTGHRGGVTSIKFRPHMKHLVSGGVDGSVLLWSLFCRSNVARQTQIRPYRFLGHQGEICAVAVSPLDTVVASASKDKTVRLWIPSAEGRSSIIKAHSSTVRTVAFSPDGECLLTGSDDKSLKIWDVETERFLTSLSGHINWVRYAEFNSTGRLAVSGSDDRTVRLWDIQHHECLHVFSDLPGMVTCVRFHPYGSCIGSSGGDNAIQIWDIRSKMLVQHYAGNAGAVRSLCFHPAGNYLLSTCDDATLKIWDLREGQVLYTLKGHEGPITHAEFSPGGDHFASGGQDEQVILWQSNLKHPRIPAGTLRHDFACFAPTLEQNTSLDQEVASSLNKKSTKRERSLKNMTLPTKLKPIKCQISADNITDSDKGAVLEEMEGHKGEDRELPLEGASVNFMTGVHVPEKEVLQSEDLADNKQLTTAQMETAQMPAFAQMTRVDVPEKAVLQADLAENNHQSTTQMEAFGQTLEHLISQLDNLTRTVSLFGERLSLTEDKVLRLEKLVASK